MADITLPKTKRRTAVISRRSMLSRAALLLSLACSPLVQAASKEDVPEYQQPGNTNTSPSDGGIRALAMGEATNSVEVAADIARSAANGSFSNAVDPRGAAYSQLNASDEFKAGGN